mgnify:CR=1 FL=1
MNATRITAIIFIYLLASAGWIFLGETTAHRSGESSGKLSGEVAELWGKAVVQKAPSIVDDMAKEPVQLGADASRIRVHLDLDYRRRGLVWYPTYLCRFEAAYRLDNHEQRARDLRLHLDFPDAAGTYENFSVTIDDQQLRTPVDPATGVDALVALEPGQTKTVKIAYMTRGLWEWRYCPGSHIGRIHDLDLEITTDFEEVDYPLGALSPTSSTKASGGGTTLIWKTGDVITRKDIGVVVPERLRSAAARVPRKVWATAACAVVVASLVVAAACWPRGTESPRPGNAGSPTSQATQREVSGEETPWLWKEAQRLNRKQR